MPILHPSSALKKESILISGERRIEVDKVYSVLIPEFPLIEISDLANCAQYAESHNPTLVVLVDADISRLEEIVQEIKANSPKQQIIAVSQWHDTASVVEFIRSGAYDVLPYPPPEDRFLISVARGIERVLLLGALEAAVSGKGSVKVRKPDAFSHIITESSTMFSLFRYLEEISVSRHPVLICGETGVGKELMAEAIHKLAGTGPFVPVNIAGVDDSVFSDTLFGHVKGAFTGALTAREGLLAQARGGVLFMDEIGDLAEQSQIKLLRLIQEHTYYPIGKDTPQKMDAKLVLATNKDLQKEVAAGRFRKDLYYRIQTHSVQIPPFRKRIEDVPKLLMYFVELQSKALGRKAPEVAPDALEILAGYDFPGNVRELEAMTNNAVATHKLGTLTAASFKQYIRERELQERAGDAKGMRRCLTLKEAEGEAIERALAQAGGSQRIAAMILGISRQALNKRLLNKSRER